MTAFNANVNQHAANTSPRNLAVQFCTQKTAVLASCQFMEPTSHQVSMRRSVQCPVPLIIPGYATAWMSVELFGNHMWFICEIHHSRSVILLFCFLFFP